MYHSHSDESIIQQKIQAILRCFVMSEIPPNLHIDITPEMAEKIMDKRPREMGPYVFREAQVNLGLAPDSSWRWLKNKTLSAQKLGI